MYIFWFDIARHQQENQFQSIPPGFLALGISSIQGSYELQFLDKDFLITPDKNKIVNL